jgi:predicted transposase/invertase (TIGR01784 family)
MNKIDKINDKMFKKALSTPQSAIKFLRKVLPEQIKKRIDFSTIEIGPTDYVSLEFKEYFSDVIIKTRITSKNSGRIPTDICFILEHKTEAKIKIFIQFLKYMVEEWQKDLAEQMPLRLIIPILFYHGKKEWGIPQAFVEQFDVDDEIKEYLLNYRYFLFDTGAWDFQDETNKDLSDDVFLLTALALMKCAYTDEVETVEEIFRFWHEKGFTKNIEDIVFFLIYISETKNINRDQLKKMLGKSKIDGGNIMETLAQQLRDEGRKIGIEEGMKEGKLDTARELIKRGVDIDIIAEATGFSREELEELTEIVH